MKAPLAMPKNAVTGRSYSGINVLLLWGAVIKRDFPCQSWLTFRQTLSLGGNAGGESHRVGSAVEAQNFSADCGKCATDNIRAGVPVGSVWPRFYRAVSLSHRGVAVTSPGQASVHPRS